MEAQGAPPTARQVVDLIRQHIGVAWRDTTVDTFKTGDPDTPVTGIAVTMMATLDVLQRAAAEGDNFIITHEPTFYNHEDRTAYFERGSDPVYTAKWEFITTHHLVIWRFHDHWHLRVPDGILAGVVTALGWEGRQRRQNDLVVDIPPATVAQLAARISRALGTRAPRVIGDSTLVTTGVALLLGSPDFAAFQWFAQADDVQVALTGEEYEFEQFEYIADAITEGRRKAVIVLGHVPSEQEGMSEATRWLRTFIPDVRVTFIPTREFFWAPR
jgi:putative NIF3 family GTP cyclohydrolase 1 type 2